MVETRCIKIKLKPGSLERVRAWSRELESRREEALQTLRDEHVMIESVFLDRTAEGDYLIYYLKAVSDERGARAGQKSSHPLDASQQQFIEETWESQKALQLVVDLDCMSEG